MTNNKYSIFYRFELLQHILFGQGTFIVCEQGVSAYTIFREKEQKVVQKKRNIPQKVMHKSVLLSVLSIGRHTLSEEFFPLP